MDRGWHGERLLLLALVALLGLAGSVSPARAATSSFSATMYSEPDDYIGQGVQQVFDPSNATFGGNELNGGIGLSASGGTSGKQFSFVFQPPGGKALTPGLYLNAQGIGGVDNTRPRMDVYGDARGCNEIGGSFEIKDLDLAADGTIDRLWLLYEQHCENFRPALFGELRVGEDAVQPAVSPATLRWPATDAGAPSIAIPALVVARDQPTTVASTSIVGDDASSFAVRTDECSGANLPVGTSCQVWVRFTPSTPGTHLAYLRVAFAGGGSADVALQGFAFGGHTGVDLVSDAGDAVGQGAPYAYAPPDSIYASGSRTEVHFKVLGVDESVWEGNFSPASGDLLAPGTYAPAVSWQPYGVLSQPSMDVFHNNQWPCGSITGQFTVNSAAWWPDGTVRSFSVSVLQHCNGATPALHGTLDFRAGDTTPLAPWMGGPNVAPSPAPPPTTCPAPSGDVGVTIDNAALYTNSRDVGLTITPPPQTSSVRIANDGGFAGADARGVQDGPYPWVLSSSGPERLPKTVYVRFVSPCIDPAQTFTDDVILDETAPVVTAASATPTFSAGASRSYRLKIRARDGLSGVAQMQLRWKGHRAKRWIRYKRTTIVHSSGAIWVRVRDRAHNVSRWRRVRLLRHRSG